MNFAERAELSGLSVRTFALLQRDIEQLLLTQGPNSQVGAVSRIGDRFSMALAESPMLPTAIVSQAVDEDGESLFTLITPAAIRADAEETRRAVAALVSP